MRSSARPMAVRRCTRKTDDSCYRNRRTFADVSLPQAHLDDVEAIADLALRHAVPRDEL